MVSGVSSATTIMLKSLVVRFVANNVSKQPPAGIAAIASQVGATQGRRVAMMPKPTTKGDYDTLVHVAGPHGVMHETVPSLESILAVGSVSSHGNAEKVSKADV